MTLIPYYLQQRIIKRIIDFVMLILLIITLFPIFWMVFSSLKSNTEILLGKIPFGNASNDVIKIDVRGPSLFVFTADGAINKFDIESKTLTKYTTIKSSATNFLFDDHNIWIATSDKGLVQVSFDDFNKKRFFNYEFKNFDINKVVSTSLAEGQNYLWLAVQQKGIESILRFNKSTMMFDKELPFSSNLSPAQATSLFSDGKLLWIGTNKGLIALDIAVGKILKTISLTDLNIPQLDIRSLTKHGNSLFFATSQGVFEYSLDKGKIINTFNMDNGLLSNRANSVSLYNDKMAVATNAGISLVDLKTKEIQNFDSIFSKIDQEGKVENVLVRSDALSTFIKDGKLFAGSTAGRITMINLSNSSVEKTFVTPKGHLTIRWRNYIDLWKNINFGLYLKNSLIICGFTMLFAMLFATLAAYALARFNFPGSNFFSIGVLATQMIPAIMYLIPIYIMFTKFTSLTAIPLKGTFFGMILVYTAFFTPFSIWILRGFFAAIPVELEEAARIDGCTPFQVFWYIALPLAIPGIVATGIYVFLTAWDELMFAWVLTNANTMTIPVGIRLFVGNYQNRFDLMMAAATVATIPVMILFFMLQKHIVKGLTAGAVKG